MNGPTARAMRAANLVAPPCEPDSFLDEAKLSCIDTMSVYDAQPRWVRDWLKCVIG